MDIQYAILGLLSWQPLSGYDLKKIIAESDLLYWSGNNNQIYNSLVQLHQGELVTQVVHQQESLPAKKVYSITPAGRDTLRRWMLAEPELPGFRSHFLIQLAFTGPLPDAEFDGLLARYEDEVDVQLRMRQALNRQGGPGAFPPKGSPRERLVWARIGEAMIDAYQRELDWVRALRRDVQAQVFNE